MSERRIEVQSRIAALERELGGLRRQLDCSDVDADLGLPVEALVVQCGDFLAAIPAVQIEVVTPMSLVSAIPHAPAAVRGTVNYRGHFAPVLDLRYILSGVLDALTPEMRLVILRTRQRIFALAVDDVEAVRSFAAADAETAPLVSTLPEYVVCIFRGEQKGVILLHPTRLFAACEADHVQELPASVTNAGQEVE